MLNEIIEWLEENNISNQSSNNNIDIDGYTLYEGSVDVVFSSNGKRYNFRVNKIISKYTPNKKIYGPGVRLYELVKYNGKWIRDVKNIIYSSKDFSNFEFLQEWFDKNTNFTKFPI